MITLALSNTEMNSFLIAAVATVAVVLIIRALYKRAKDDQES